MYSIKDYQIVSTYSILENRAKSGMAVFNSLEFQRFADISQDSVPKYLICMKERGLLFGVENKRDSVEKRV
jgi:hypothetical protein